MVNEIISNVPNIVSSFFDEIFLVSEAKDELYKIFYDGKKLTISEKKTYSEIRNILSEKVEKDIKNKEKIIDEKSIVFNRKFDDYTMIFISKLEIKIESEKGILIIADDSPMITNFFKKIFEEEYNVLVAKDGSEAINLVNEHKDEKLLGVFLDLKMPIMSGYDVLEYFKANNLFKEIPVSIISGDDSEEGIGKATAYEVVDMLQKPFTKESAKSIVDKTIRFSPKA